MGTVIYACGCSFSHSMFGKREMVGMNLCSKHLANPEIQQSRLCDVQHLVMMDQPSPDG